MGYVHRMETRQQAAAGDARLLDYLLLDCIEVERWGLASCRHCLEHADLPQPIVHRPGCVVGQIIEIRKQREAAQAPASDAPESKENQ